METSKYNYIDFAIQNSNTAVIMAPVMEDWDYGKFCASLTNLLVENNYRVSIYDSSCCSEFFNTVEETSLYWLEIIKRRHPQIDLLIGQAYGGTIVFNLINEEPHICQNVITISSPGYCDSLLRYRLKEIIDLLYNDRYDEALLFLKWRVQSEYSPCTLTDKQDFNVSPNAKKRLINGFEQLCRSGIRTISNEFTGNIISLYGNSSRLVVKKNVPKVSYNHKHHVLENCGMRPFCDAEKESLDVISKFINKNI